MKTKIPTPEQVQGWIDTKSLGYNRAYAAALGYVELAKEVAKLKQQQNQTRDR